MLIIEEYLLLIHDDSGRRLVSSEYLEQLAAGGLLVELAVLERIIVEDGRWGQPGRVLVRDAQPTGNELLDEALAIVAARPRKPQSLLDPIARRKPARRALDHLVATGVVGTSREHMLGIIPTTRWQVRHAEDRDAIRSRVGDALVKGVTPDVRTAALISLLSALDQAAKVIGVPEGSELRPRDINRRAKEIARGEWAGAAVGRYVESVTMSVVAGVAVVASTTTSSG